MGSVLAIVSKKVFEHDFGRAGVGEVVTTATYTSANKTFEKLVAGGDLYLVTVAPGEQLLLVGVLRQPTFANGGWSAKPNLEPVRDISALVGSLTFESGTGITAKPGALAMSLQTPRVLTPDDVALLEGGKTSDHVTSATADMPVARPAKLEKPSKAAAPAGTDPDLATALTELAANRGVSALDALLHAWERCRSIEIADLVEALGAAIARGLPAIAGNRKTIDAAWRDVADQLRPADVPRLIAALDQGSAPQVEGWLDILLRFPIDPRLADPALSMTMKFVSSSAGPTRTRAFRLAERIADGRGHARMQRLAEQQADAWNWKELREKLDKLAAKLPRPPALPAADAAAVDALAAAIAALEKRPPVPEAELFVGAVAALDDRDRLLTAVLANPHDEANRAVYADYLLEHADPRGELIALQTQPTPLSRDQQARERALLRDPDNQKAWLGPLLAAVTEPVFERGFLTGCTVAFKSAKQRADLAEHPLWATVEQLRSDELELVRSPALRSIRRVAGLSFANVQVLAGESDPVAFAELANPVFSDTGDFRTDYRETLDAWRIVLASPAFRRLRHFGPFEMTHHNITSTIGNDPRAWRWILDSPTGQQLASLALCVDSRPELGPWLALLKERTHLERLQLDTGSFGREGNTIVVSYGFERAPSRLVWTFHHSKYRDESDFAPDTLAGVDGVAELAIVLADHPTKPQRQKIAQLAKQYETQFERVTVS